VLINLFLKKLDAFALVFAACQFGKPGDIGINVYHF
jgi:hypothetical protein